MDKESTTPFRNFVYIACASVFMIPAIVISMPDQIEIPIVKKHEKGDPPEPGIFSHWNHDQYRCYACHPSIFPEKKLGFVHDDMKKGKFCGTCHDGQSAWHFNDKNVECETCHVIEDGALDDVDLDDLF